MKQYNISKTIVFGGASLSGEGKGYGFGPLNEKEAQALIKSSWDRGIKLYDTAPIYGFGLSEERLGRYLDPNGYIISKGGVDWHENKRVNLSNHPDVIEKMFYQSLKRLKREAIDLYMIHWPDHRHATLKAIEVLLKIKEKGDLKHIGLCNSNQEELALLEPLTPINAIQNEASFLKTNSFINIQKKESCQWMSWGTLGKGILTGRVHKKRQYHPDDARSWAPWWKNSPLDDHLDKANKFIKIANQYNISPGALAISYNISELNIDQVIIGFKSEADLSIALEWENQKANHQKALAHLKQLT